MKYEGDFVSGELVEFVIDGKKFKYKPVTAGEVNSWINEYLIPQKYGTFKRDSAKLNQLKLKNLVEVPYSAETISKILKLDKEIEWNALNQDQQWKLLCALSPGVFSKIIEQINKLDNPKEIKN